MSKRCEKRQVHIPGLGVEMAKTITVNVCWNDGSLDVFDGISVEDKGEAIVLSSSEKVTITCIRKAATKWYSVRREKGSPE